MRLQFLLQLEAYQNSELKDLVKVEDSKVKVDGNEIVNLDNIPFAAKNRRYRELKDEIEKIESEIRTFESVLAAGPNTAIEELLGKKRTERYSKKEELSEHETFLFYTAVRIAQQQGDRISERMARAIQAFEDGRASDANAILEEALHDAKELRRDIAKTKELLKQHQENAVVSISELLLKASVTLADDSRPVDDRIEETHEIYREAYALANESDYDREKYMELLEKYRLFLIDYAKYAECCKIQRELLNIYLSVLGDEDPAVADNYNYLGFACYSTGDYANAMECYDKALQIKTSLYGDNHRDLAGVLINIGVIHDDNGDHAKALIYYERALNILNDEADPLLGNVYNSIGCCHLSLGDYQKALEYMVKALDIRKSLLGDAHPYVATTRLNVGAVYTAAGDYVSAEKYCCKALSDLLAIYGNNHPAVASAYSISGGLHESQGNYEAALECYERYLNISLAVYGETHPQVSISYNCVGGACVALKEYERALDSYEKALNVGLAVYGENHSSHAVICNNLGFVLSLCGDYAKAVEYLEKSLNICRCIYGEDHATTKEVKANLEAAKRCIR